MSVEARPSERGAAATLVEPELKVDFVDRRGAQLFLVVVTLSAVVAAWHFTVVLFDVKKFILPTPFAVAEKLIEMRTALFDASVVTLRETLVGFGIATVVGVAIAVAVSTSKAIERIVYPPLVVMNAVPKIALAPIFLSWFGLGETPRVLVAVLLAVFPIVISSAVALVEVDKGLLLLGRSTNASSWRIFWKIKVPAALPGIMGGLKIGITMALTGAVVGEFVGGNSGLGYLITSAQGVLQLDIAFAAIVVLAVLGIALFYLLELLENLVGRESSRYARTPRKDSE